MGAPLEQRIDKLTKGLEQMATKNALRNKGTRPGWNGGAGDGASPAARVANAERVAATARDPKADRTKGFKTPREFIQAVMHAGMHPFEESTHDVRLKGLRVKTVGSDEATGINDAYGGFLVPEEFSPDFLKVAPEDDPIGAATRKVPMGNPVVKIPARTDKDHTTSVAGGLTVTRRPETVAGTPSRMQVEQVRLEAHSLFGFSYATEELLLDSPQSFAALLADGFNDQFTYHLIKERLYGTGAGEFLGILTSLSASSLGPTVSVAKETGQAAATIVALNIFKMVSRCWGYDKAIWLANHDTLPQLCNLNQSVGTGGIGMIWLPSMREGAPSTLMGRPVYFSEYAKTLGTQGDIILANWSEYLEGTLQPMQSDESIHVRFLNHERAFKFWLRNAGAPWWKTALTPAYSTLTLSPFIVLDTRA